MTLRIGKIYIRPWALLPLIFLTVVNPPEYVCAMLLCALLHEFGHLAALKAVGGRVERIDIMLFGAHIKTCGRMCSYPADAFVFGAGALANLCGMILCYTAYLFLPSTEIMFLIFANLFYAIFNMLPIRGLDGGAFLEALLLMKCEPETAGKWCEKLSVAFILMLFLAALWIISLSGNNFSLLFVVVYLFANL